MVVNMRSRSSCTAFSTWCWGQRVRRGQKRCDEADAEQRAYQELHLAGVVAAACFIVAFLVLVFLFLLLPVLVDALHVLAAQSFLLLATQSVPHEHAAVIALGDRLLDFLGSLLRVLFRILVRLHVHLGVRVAVQRADVVLCREQPRVEVIDVVVVGDITSVGGESEVVAVGELQVGYFEAMLEVVVVLDVV